MTKPMTAKELAALSHKDLASVSTKRRIAAALRRGEKARRAQRETEQKPRDDEPTRTRRDFRGGARTAEEPRGMGPQERLARADRKE